MAKQIITLGIGAMDTLTPFITTGLEIGAAPVAPTFTTPDARTLDVPYQDRALEVPYQDRILEVRE